MAKDKKKKAPRPRAETPRGFRDYFGQDVIERRRMLERICEVYHQYGFDPLESSAIETVEALGKFLPDVDRPHAGIFAWQDDDEAWLGLRYDLTAPLARVVAQHRLDLPNPYRRYAVGPVWRNEKPGPGRFRQFYQCDADTVGTPTVAADAEICMMLCDTLEAAGINRGNYVVRVNNRKVLNGVLEVAGILDPADPERFAHERGIVLRAIDKLDRLGPDGVRALLGEGRKDESGDFTKGADLADRQIEKIMSFVRVGEESRADQESFLFTRENFPEEPREVFDQFSRSKGSRPYAFLRKDAPSPRPADPSLSAIEKLADVVKFSKTGMDGLDELETINDLVRAQEFGPDRIFIDPSVVRGLGYYTGPVYEAELTFNITDEKGRPRQFGSVAGGGRYDDLVKRFTGQAVPATGISIGVDRLLAALREIGRAGQGETAGPVVILAMDRAEMAAYQTMCAELRAAGIRAEVFLGGGNMAKQLKYADKRASPVAVIEGGDERDQSVVTLKDLALGARLAAEIETHAEWKAQPAQITVPRADLVAEVRRMLARAGG